MYKTLFIISTVIIFTFSSCNDKGTNVEVTKTQETVEYKNICINHSTDSLQLCIAFDTDFNKSIFELLSKLNLYNIVPNNNEYIGKAQSIRVDTLGGGILPDTIASDSTVIMLSDLYYNQYQYNEDGFIKKYSYIDDVKPDACITVSYHYEKNRLKSILAINPRSSSSFTTGEAPSNYLFVPDSLYKIDLVYTTNNALLDQISIIKNGSTIPYHVMYIK